MKKLYFFLAMLAGVFFFSKNSFAQSELSSYTCQISTSFKAQDTIQIYQQERILATLTVDWKEATIMTPEGTYFLSHRAKKLFQDSTQAVALGKFKYKKVLIGTQLYTEKRIKLTQNIRGWDYYDGEEIVLKLRYTNQEGTYNLTMDVMKEDAETWKLLSLVSNRFIHRVLLDYENNYLSFASMVGAIIGALASL